MFIPLLMMIQEQHRDCAKLTESSSSQSKKKNSNSSNETVIDISCDSARTGQESSSNWKLLKEDATSEQVSDETMTTTQDESSGKQRANKFKSFLILTSSYLNPFHHNQQHQQHQLDETSRKSTANNKSKHLNLLALAQRYFGARSDQPESQSRSAPVTPLKSSRANGLLHSVRFREESESTVRGSQPSSEQRANPESVLVTGNPTTTNRSDEEHNEGDVVDRLFGSSRSSSDNQALEGANGAHSECPMDAGRFREHGYKLIEYISNYLTTISDRRVTPLNIEPGYLKSLIQSSAPQKGEPFVAIMRDFESHIMCGITHWQHPHFHAYFPAGNAYPSILADMLSDALGCVGFSWAASPAYTELEIIMLDWMGKMIGLPEEFLCLSSDKESKGGGVIQGSASECVLVNLLAARHWAIEKLRKKYPNSSDGLLLSKLIGYCSKEAHSCVEKAAMIGFIKMRALDTDEHHSLRGSTLAKAIKADQANGLEPFLVCATLGTTSCVSFDNLEELGEVCEQHQIWLHVDAAYAGSAFICPEFKYLMRGIEKATSFNMNPNKWLLINFDCSLMWVKDRFKLTRAFVVDPLYLQHSFSDQAIDYRHWGIPLSRRFRALKLWFVIRNYGVEGLQSYIRNHVRLAKLFEQLILADPRFSITNQVLLGLVCFRLVGSNALNQRLLSMINGSGKLHMVPASLNGRYVIRFCVCDQNAKEEDIHYAYECISQFATDLFKSIRAGKERIRAISQQNTIDVSSISLHKQQSASAEPLQARNSDEELDEQQVLASRESPSQSSPREAARQYLMRRNSRLTDSAEPISQQQPQEPVDEDDLEQEIVLDSLEDEELDEQLEASEQHQSSCEQQERRLTGAMSASNEQGDQIECRSPLARRLNGLRSSTMANQQLEHLEEAEDEVFTLAERKHRMSVRYKREFFVRVVSDPRVYRASISGDINVRASCFSLANQQQHQQPTNSSSSDR